MNARLLTYSGPAKLSGLSLSALSRKIRGIVTFKENDKAKLVEIFGKPIKYLLQRDDT